MFSAETEKVTAYIWGKLHLKRNIISKYFPAERDHLRVPFGKGRYESDFMNPAPGSSALFLLLEVGVLEFGSLGVQGDWGS